MASSQSHPPPSRVVLRINCFNETPFVAEDSSTRVAVVHTGTPLDYNAPFRPWKQWITDIDALNLPYDNDINEVVVVGRPPQSLMTYLGHVALRAGKTVRFGGNFMRLKKDPLFDLTELYDGASFVRQKSEESDRLWSLDLVPIANRSESVKSGKVVVLFTNKQTDTLSSKELASFGPELFGSFVAVVNLFGRPADAITDANVEDFNRNLAFTCQRAAQLLKNDQRVTEVAIVLALPAPFCVPVGLFVNSLAISKPVAIFDRAPAGPYEFVSMLGGSLTKEEAKTGEDMV